MHFYLSRWMNLWHKKTSHWIDQLGSYIRIRLVNGVQKKLWMDWNLTCQLMEVSVQYHQLPIEQQLSRKVYLGGVFKIHHISIHYRTDNLQWSKIYFVFSQGIYLFSVSFIFVGIGFHFLTKNVNVSWYINDQKKLVRLYQFKCSVFKLWNMWFYWSDQNQLSSKFVVSNDDKCYSLRFKLSFLVILFILSADKKVKMF